MKKAASAAAIVLSAGILFQLRDARPVRAQLGASGPEPVQFRVFAGLTDSAEKDWPGRITVSGGQILSMRGERFSAGDKVFDDGRFEFKTKKGNLEDQTGNPGGQTDWNDPRIQRLIPQAVVVRARGAANMRFRFVSAAGEFEFDAASVPYHRAFTALGGNARVERMPAEERLSEEGWADDNPAIAVTPGGQIHAAWLSYQDKGDYVVASDGRQNYRLTEKGDHHGPAIAVDNKGWVHVVWAQRENAEFHLYWSVMVGYRWSRATRLTVAGTSHFAPFLASDGAGRLALAWQALRNGQSVVLLRIWDGRNWSAEQQASATEGNAWTPSAAFVGGKLWVAWDSYATGNYQIYTRAYTGAAGGPVERVTMDGNFAVRPSVAVSREGVPVVAWEESDANWGKDFAFLADRRGTTLYKNRRVRVAFRDEGIWKTASQGVEESLPAAIRRFVQQPRILFDAAGRLHMAFRCRTSTATARMDVWASGARWESFVTRLEGGAWQAAIPLAPSVGRNGMRIAIAASQDSLHAVWPSDNRSWPGVKYGDVEVYAARLPLSGAQSTLTGGVAIGEAAPALHPRETEDTARIRDYRVKLGGRVFRIVRGDVHRHTELSHDGAGDGSLEDLYRYTLDAAAMDYAHVADHQMGSDEEYNWWITQKSNDLYFQPGRFVPLYGYERSVPYPNGHRNVIWAERGWPVLRISPAEQKGGVNTGSVLYPYLEKTNGIVTSHTSATQQGTDWRDNDPALEPIVEIYQGFESNYESPDAPRAWKEGDKAVHTGVRPAGYIWNAWAKGLELGVQASSDHVSTHTSYACVVVEEFTRKGIVDAMRKRHTYAATDSIVIDYRMETSGGEAMMGDSVTSSAPPKLKARILGTGAIKRVDLIRNNAYIHRIEPNAKEASLEFADANPVDGKSYYYVRVEQADGQLAWSSPIWVRYSR